MPEPFVPRVLVLDAHSRAAVETVQSLGREGVIVDAASDDATALAMYSRYVRHSAHAPRPSDPDTYLAWVRSVERVNRYSLIVCSTEASLIAFRTLRECDPLREKAVLPGNNALDTALDKRQTHSLAARQKIRVPATRVIAGVDAIGEAAGFPTVLKPARSKVLRNGRLATLEPVIVTDESSRRMRLLSWLPHTAVLEQEHIEGRGLGIEVLYSRGRLLWSFAHERIHEWPLSGGASSYRRAICPPAAALEAARSLLDALD